MSGWLPKVSTGTLPVPVGLSSSALELVCMASMTRSMYLLLWCWCGVGEHAKVEARWYVGLRDSWLCVRTPAGSRKAGKGTALARLGHCEQCQQLHRLPLPLLHTLTPS